MYLSSQSRTLQKHFNGAAKNYIRLFKLNKKKLIIDVGSNDGIALDYYKKKGFKNILGIEPASNIANIANKKGIKTINSFLNFKISKRFLNKGDLVTASNIFAHNRNIIKLAKHLISIIKSNGILIIEVQYLISMIKNNLFDNIYHEHIHYWSLTSLENFFKKLGSTIVNVDKINTHGGSLRIYIKKNKRNQNQKVKKILKDEIKFGIKKKKIYLNFNNNLKLKKKKFKNFFMKNKKKNIIGYGAAAKTSTLLNYFNVSKNLKYVIDDNILKQNHYIPGTTIKIVSKESVENKIDFLIVFAWNYFEEIKKKIKYASKIISIRKFFE